MEIVDDPSKIILDVMICGNETLNTTETVDKSAYGNFLRNKDIHDFFVNYDSIYQEMDAFPTVNYRYLFEEHDKASGEAELNFNGNSTWPLQLMGREDAKVALEEGPGVAFKRHYESRKPKEFLIEP